MSEISQQNPDNPQESAITTETTEVKVETIAQPALQIQTQANTEHQNRSSSPTSQTGEGSPKVISPRFSRTSNRPGSPTINRSKLDAVKKLIAKEDEKLEATAQRLSTLQKDKVMLEEDISRAANSKPIEQQKPSVDELEQVQIQFNELSHKLEHVKQVLGSTEQQAAEQQKRLTTTIADLKLRNEQQAKEQQLHKQREVEFNAANEELNKLSQTLRLLKNAQQEEEKRKTQIRQQIELKNKLREEQVKKENELAQLQTNKKNLENSRKAELEKKIEQAKQRINSKKSELSEVEKYDSAKKGQALQSELKSIKQSNAVLSESIAKLEQIEKTSSKENTQSKDGEKKKEKRLNDLKNKNEQITKKIKEIKVQITNQTPAEQKKIKYEQKMPEELLALLDKNQQIKKDIKKIAQKIQFEKDQMNLLVPLGVIENMNKKIAALITDNESVVEFNKKSEELRKENQILAKEKESIEWGQNHNLRLLETELSRNIEKNKLIEEEIVEKKKLYQQINSKLQEYVKAYPDFKPEKKKKQQLEVVVQKKDEKNKKGGSAVVQKNQRSPVEDPKKKKGNIVEPNITRTVSVSDEVVEDTKVSKKKKKGQVEKVEKVEKVQVKQQPSPPPKVEVKVQEKIVNVQPDIKKKKKR